jgi:TPR repeat protein
MPNNLKEGLSAFQSENYHAAFDLLIPFAEGGNAEAQCIIGNIYQLGLGKEINLSEAFRWYMKSSEQGYGVASSNLAGMLAVGFDNVNPDKVKANKFLAKAKEQGFLHNIISTILV